MEFVVPDYYARFRCVAGACRHNCCIGWEIDIDEETLARYETVDGALGVRLKEQISREGDPHFVLGEGERCPFLNEENLCDLIIALGEESLCSICAQHPRFHVELPGRTESGLGLCCEAAGRLILGQKEPVCLLVSGEKEEEDELVALRDELITLLQRRDMTLEERAEELLHRCGGVESERSWGEWCTFLLDLERLDEEWTVLVKNLSERWESLDTEGFARCMADRETEYEQLMVYLLYRHLAKAVGEADLAARAGFVVFGYELLRALGTMLWQDRGAFTLEDQVELARLFSSEIEYSEENLDALLDELC